MEFWNFIQFIKLVARYCGNSCSVSTAVGDVLVACEERQIKHIFSVWSLHVH